MSRRVSSASEWDRPPQADPRPAIAQFRRDLEARGIALVVMPTPVKPSVHPDGLAPRYDDVTGALQNASYDAFLADLRGDGTRVFDRGEGLAASRRFGAVWVRRILQADGSLWRSSRNADVLLLGDSFTNIYTLESMGWGTSAGLAEQLSYALARPIDRLVQNDDAAFATRAMVAKDAARLTGKRVVVYQFATRELAFGDWRVQPLP